MIKTTTLTGEQNTNAEQSPVLDIGLRSTLDEIVLKWEQDLLQQALEHEIEEARKRINAENSDSSSSVTRIVRDVCKP